MFAGLNADRGLPGITAVGGCCQSRWWSLSGRASGNAVMQCSHVMMQRLDRVQLLVLQTVGPALGRDIEQRCTFTPTCTPCLDNCRWEMQDGQLNCFKVRPTGGWAWMPLGEWAAAVCRLRPGRLRGRYWRSRHDWLYQYQFAGDTLCPMPCENLT